MADLHRPCRLSLLSRPTKTPAAAAAADYGDVFGGPPKFSGSPPQPDEYGDIFGGFAAGKSGGAGIPFLDLPALGDDEASVGAGLDYGEVFGCSGSGRFAIDFREVFSELESEERPAVETGQPNIPTILSDDCNRNSSASDRNQSSPNELPPHIQDGTQQFNVSYNKSDYGVQGDLPNGTTHVTELHEVPGFAVVVESSFNSKMTGSATTLNGEHIDLSNEVLEKEIRKETSFQVPFLNNAQKNSRISFLGEEDVQLVSKFTEERKGHVKEAWGISSEKNANLMKFNFGTPPSDHSLASYEHLSSDGDKSLFRKVFLTVSDISLRTQPSGIPPPSRPPPKLQSKEVKDSIGKVGSGSPPFLDLEVDAKSEAAASAAAMREAMEKAQAKLKSVRESMEKRRPNSRNSRQFGLNEEHRRTAKLLDDDRKQLKVDDAYEASEHGHRTKGNHGSGPMRGANRAFAVSDLNEKIEPKGHTEKVLEALVEGCGKESLADQLSNNIGGQTVELKAEKQFYELLNNGSKHEFVYVSKKGNNDHNFKEKLQDPDQKQSHKPEVPIEIESLRAYREDDNELEACPELGQAIGDPKASFEDQRSMNNKEHSLGKDEHGIVRAMLYSRSEKRVEEFKEDISKSKWWTTNDVNGHNKVKADEDNNVKADLEHEEKKRLKEVQEMVENDKRKKAVIELAEEEKRLKTACDRDEDEKRLKEAHECEEEEQRLKATREREEEERRLKAAREHEEEEKRLKAACEREEEEKKLRAAREFEEEEKRLRAARECEEEVKRQRAACERVEEEKWLRAACEREEQEKMLRAAREREEAEKRLRVAREREEEEKRLRAAHENEEEERRLRAARGHEEEERRLRAACEHEEEERRLMAAREHKEEEKRLRVAYEHEEEERRLKEDLQREEEDKRMRAALEVEHKRLKAIHEHEEEINRLKAAHDHEEEENQLKAAREHEEEVKRSKAPCDSEMEENKLKPKHEEEKSLKVTHKYEDQNERLKAALDRDKEEKQLQAVLEREGEDQRPESLWECEEEEQRLQATYAHEEKEKKLQEAYEHAEEEKGLQAADEHNEEQGTLRMAWEHEKDEKKLKVAYEHEEEEKPLQPSCKLGDEKRQLIADYECEEDKKKLKVACELEEDEMRQKTACKCEEENRLKDAREQRKDESIKVDEECSEENGRLEFRGHPLPFLFKKKGNNVEYDVQVNIELKNNRSDSKEADVTRGNVKFEKKGLMVSGQEVTTNGSSTARDVFSMTVNEGKSGAARMDREMMDHGEREIQKQRERNMEVERLRILEEERERQKEREKDRIAVENVIRESRDRAFAEARERAAAERAATESRQRALSEARERAERTSAEKTAIEAARLRAERAAVERATAEARQRAIEKVMVAVKDKPDYSSGQNSFHSDDRSFHATAGETAQRCKARLERHQRTAERAGKALAEKNERDILAQREQAERNRLAETLDADIRRWSKGKEGNLRALLSTLQYILGPESGWQPVPLTEVITAAAVKKAYRKATLCVHPDKLQQRGASIQQKYICEKVFDLLKDAWNKFNSEER